jgi:hypothetical protein
MRCLEFQEDGLPIRIFCLRNDLLPERLSSGRLFDVRL